MSSRNAVISYPGHRWRVLWDDLGTIQLSIVAVLVILGQDTTLEIHQLCALSSLCYVPRLLPAPQALLWPTRQVRLRGYPAAVAFVESGWESREIPYFADRLLNTDQDRRYNVSCVEVTTNQPLRQSLIQRFFRRIRIRIQTKTNLDVELQTLSPRADKHEPPAGPRAQDWVRINPRGAVFWATAMGSCLSIALFMISICFGDGLSMIATILFSALAGLIGIVHRGTILYPRLQESTGRSSSRRETVCIRRANGSFLIVHCTAQIARELFVDPEIDYKISSPAIQRLLSGFGMVVLMLGIVMLANARTELQIAWASALGINLATNFVIASFGRDVQWDFSCYNVVEQGIQEGGEGRTFTEAVWKTILVTKDIQWVKRSNAVPKTAVWNRWLNTMQSKAKSYGIQRATVRNRWKRGAPEQSVVWDGPDVQEWDPKAEWDRINGEWNEEYSGYLSAMDVEVSNGQRTRPRAEQERLGGPYNRHEWTTELSDLIGFRRCV